MIGYKKRAAHSKMVARRRRLNYWLAGGAVFFTGLIALVIYLNIRSQLPAGPEQITAAQGNAHIQQDTVSPIAYNATPPTSGPHYEGIVPWGIHRQPQRYEQVLHNLEDGGVAIYYQCDGECTELEMQLEELVDGYLRAERRLLLMPNDPTWREGDSQPWHEDMGQRIALTAWQRIDKFDEFDSERIRAFIKRYEGIDHHR